MFVILPTFLKPRDVAFRVADIRRAWRELETNDAYISVDNHDGEDWSTIRVYLTLEELVARLNAAETTTSAPEPPPAASFADWGKSPA